MTPRRIDFDLELARGLEAYQDRLARWWLERADDAAHRRAYRRIAAYLADSFPHLPRRIADYGCGAGHLLAEMARQFPRARFAGYDASRPLLESARRRLAFAGPRVELIEAVLPDFALTPRADVVTVSFPNFLPKTPAREIRPAAGERAMARYLAGADASRYARLVYDRVLARNARGLLRRGGTCIRVEYCGARREEISRRDLERLEFAEGSLSGAAALPFFRVAASMYIRSRVIEDVFQQSGRRGDAVGGYSITVLTAP
jgi:SAM-dependent methyltransferase